MKACFIKLDSVENTENGTVIINANNISSVRRLNYNDTVQTFILMTGGERFGVHQTPEEIIEMLQAENAEIAVF